MQRYFTNLKNNNKFTLSNNDTYHINTVMRMNINDKLEIVYNNEVYISEIIKLKPNVICKAINILEKYNKIIPQVTIIQSLIKDNKLEYVFQKSTELGIYELILFSADRSIVKVKDNDKKMERWNKILKEASEQSKRNSIPILNKIIDIKEINNLDYNYKFLCTVNEESKYIKEELQKVNINDRIVFVVGPEGGFTDNEEKEFFENGFIPVSLGQNVLRTETAGLFILSVINYHFTR